MFVVFVVWVVCVGVVVWVGFGVCDFLMVSGVRPSLSLFGCLFLWSPASCCCSFLGGLFFENFLTVF